MTLDVRNITLSFGERIILDNVSFILNEKSRAALVGVNGSGKSTLFKIISSNLEPDDGRIIKDKTTRISYASQESVLYSELTLKEEVFKSLNSLDIKEHEKEKRYSLISEGLGFKGCDKKKCSDFSQGFKMRIALLKCLVTNPDFLLLDEPTNYLDIETRMFLIKYLSSLLGGYLIVSHDRYFLDKTINEVYEIQNTHLTPFKGTYTEYEKQKEKNDEVLLKNYLNQQKEIEKTTKFIETFRYKATKSKQVQSRILTLEKTEMLSPPESVKKYKFTIQPSPFSSNDVIKIENLNKSFSDKKIISDLSLYVKKKDRLAVIGRNGEGKSTLLRLILSLDKNFTGEIKLAENIKLKYFRGDDEFDPLSYRSGGEKTRDALMECFSQPSSLYVLDEPTNHLDINTKDSLLSALQKYDGTIIFVSHDVHFIKNLATKILYLKNTKGTLYDGDWDYFVSKTGFDLNSLSTPVAESAEDYTQNKTRDTKITNINTYVQSKKEKNEKRRNENKAKQTEEEISLLEKQIILLENKMLEKEIYTSFEKSSEILQQIDTLKKEKEKKEELWFSLTL